MALTPQRAANLAENPWAGQGAVLLDIGDGVGAVVVTCPAGWEGAEVEVEALDGQIVPHGHGPDQAHEHPHEHADPHEHDHPHEHEHDHPLDHDHRHDHGHRPHVAVVPRPAPDGTLVHSAVFPALPVGRYRLTEPESGTSAEVTVRDGYVTDLDWDS